MVIKPCCTFSIETLEFPPRTYVDSSGQESTYTCNDADKICQLIT